MSVEAGKLSSNQQKNVLSLDDSTPVKITFSLSKPDSYPAEETAVTIHQFRLA
jgi:hypothetical protein